MKYHHDHHPSVIYLSTH